ncbi:MAG: membrane integrity-associated transporter subunit PqiC [Opitutaceae bacterium]|nr:membrane integrity-associated transporter subunit PqiC [Opitutaceae bacterium]
MTHYPGNMKVKGIARTVRPAMPAGVVVAVLLLAVLAGPGCSILPEAAADPTRYYVMDDPAAADAPVAAAPGSEGRVAIRSIELPAYLRNSRSMVVRAGENEVRYEDFSRWAEPLEAGIQRVLKERLAAVMGVSSVASFPLGAGETRQWDLRVRVMRCEGNAPRAGGSGVLFSAGYQIVAATDGAPVAQGEFAVTDLAWDGHDFGELARQLSRAVARLATDIAGSMPKR